MKVAVTAWEDKVSPVFDSARMLLVVEIEKSRIISRQTFLFRLEETSHLRETLCNLGIDVLICGAISRMPAWIIESTGIKLISFIGGKVEDVLETFARGRPIVPAYLMPGCAPAGQRTEQRK